MENKLKRNYNIYKHKKKKNVNTNKKKKLINDEHLLFDIIHGHNNN